MKVLPTPAQIEVMTSLSSGDEVVVSNQRGIRWRGTVETADASQGLLWIQTDAGERRLVDLPEFIVHRPNR